MSLADLKKSSTPSRASKARPQQISLDAFIDDFIDDATVYAAGKSQSDPTMADVIALASRFTVPDSSPVQAKPRLKPESLQPLLQSDPVPSDRQKQKSILKITKGNEPFRKATFTLSESAIAHLAEVASGCDVAKSKLIRFLIEHHYSLSPSERKQKEASIIVD